MGTATALTVVVYVRGEGIEGCGVGLGWGRMGWICVYGVVCKICSGGM